MRGGWEQSNQSRNDRANSSAAIVLHILHKLVYDQYVHVYYTMRIQLSIYTCSPVLLSDRVEIPLATLSLAEAGVIVA